MNRPHITLVYLTARKNPFIEWFFSSLALQVTDADVGTETKLIVVDRWNEVRSDWTEEQRFERETKMLNSYLKIGPNIPITIVPPKPTVWAGAHRITSKDHFAASNARNTGLCMAPDGFIAYVDDLSVLLPGWWNSVVQAAREDYIVCGMYRKVHGLTVDKGRIVSFIDKGTGHDSRKSPAVRVFGHPVRCLGEWLYGCSVGMPVEALLKINGWDEDCDGAGFEDCVTGWMLQHHSGYQLKIAPRMMTWESEEGHILDPSEQVGKGEVRQLIDNPEGFPDCQHALLNWAKRGERKSSIHNPDIRELRQLILAGGKFPIRTEPTHHWADGKPIFEA